LERISRLKTLFVFAFQKYFWKFWKFLIFFTSK
jgi:hypothetical protein